MPSRGLAVTFGRGDPSIGPEFSFRTRAANLRGMAAGSLDILVIGGGIVGTWVALMAARRGYRTGLVEKGDFASGTSGKTSRLVHGGLRYLRQLRLGLVRQAARERDRLLRIAPTLVKPVTFLIPVYRRRGPSAWKLRLGLWVYDALSKEKLLPRRRWISPKQALELEPALDREGLVAAALYSDAVTNDARLVLAVVRAAHDAGALVANYARVSELIREGGTVRGAHVIDEETSVSSSVHARIVVNATGAWAPDLQRGPNRLRMRPTKGAHLLVPRERLDLRHAIVLFGVDRRMMFAIPWGRNTLVGTTDTDYRGYKDSVVPDRADADYLLHAANECFPESRLSDADIVGAYAGLRPLLDTGESEESALSRRHAIVEDPDGLVTVVGGKLTTAAAMAEEVLDRLAPRLGGPRLRSLAAEPLRIADPNVEGHVDIPRVVREEMAMRLNDVLVRRLPIFYDAVDQGLKVATESSLTLAGELGWDEARRLAELTRYRALVEAHRRWRGESG